MCDCIKINYIPIGQEPVSIEVTSNGVINSRNYYEFTYDEYNFTISWDGIQWCLLLITEKSEVLLWVLAEDTDCPIGEWTNEADTDFFTGFSIDECEPKKTVTYSKISEGWNSFWSYQPDWMTEMNSIFYTFKNGELWKHNVNTTRNNFYNTQYGSKIRTIFNEQPLEVKVFNTLSLNSTHPWSAEIYTNISAGAIDYTYFVEKENQWFAYIRRFNNTIDVKALSTQGVGTPSIVDTANPIIPILTFSFNVDQSISVGDKLYKKNFNNLVLVGTITNISLNTISVDISVGTIPSITDFLISVKDSQAESFGSRGYYMNVYLSNDLPQEVKLFSVGSSVFKSFL